MVEELESNINDSLEAESPDVEDNIDYSLSQLKGLGKVTENKLIGFGVTSLIDLCIRGSKEISEITGVTKSTTDTWCMGSHKLLEEKGIIRDSSMSVLDLLEYQKQSHKIKTKCKALDGLFNGGLEPEATYEVYGQFGAGKTQFCNTLTVEVINAGDNVVWIDCEDTFKPRRIIEIIQAREYGNEDEAIEMLKHITYYYCPNTEQMMGTVNALSTLLMEKKPKLVVLDGAIGQFREEYLGRGTLAERQMQIARLMTHIKNISYYFKCSVIFTNQVMSDPSVMFGDPIKPIGGNVVAHASGYRLYFKKPGKKHVARMVDSPEHAQADAEFILNNKGVDDVEED
jgi:DNA repair protein RadA